MTTVTPAPTFSETAMSRAEEEKIIAAARAARAGAPFFKSRVDGILVLYRPMEEVECRQILEGRKLGAWVAKACLLFPTWEEFCVLCTYRVLLPQKMALEVARISGMDDQFNLRPVE